MVYYFYMDWIVTQQKLRIDLNNREPTIDFTYELETNKTLLFLTFY